MIRRLAQRLGVSGDIDERAFDGQFAAALAAEHAVLLVAEAERAVAGYLLGTVAPMFVYNGALAFVQELYVEETHRRRGVGRTLVEQFTDVAASRGATVTALATSRAGAFYESLGFTGGATYYKRPLAPR